MEEMSREVPLRPLESVLLIVDVQNYCCSKDGDEIVMPKTSSSVFNSTNIDYVLRNLNCRQLIICRVLTDQCVESAVRNACDLNYLVTLVPEA
jgi:nicotinamidase-related amidase